MSEKKDIVVNAKAETVKNEKTDKQDASLEALKKKKAEADKAAEEAHLAKEAEKAEKERLAKEEAERKAKEEAEKAAEEARRAEQNKQLMAAGAAVAAAALGSAGNAVKRKTGGLFKGLLIGLVLGLLLGGFGMWYVMRDPLPAVSGTNDTSVVDADVVLEDNGFIGYTAADFEDAVLGAASEHQELIVMEQPLSIETSITKAGLGNWAIFSKVQNVTYYGTGVYTVDLSHIDARHIEVDNDTRTVYISIPHTVLQYINPDLESTQFEDPERGLLAFGDIKLTPEEQNELAKSVEASMRERLDSEDLYAAADEFAVMKTWEIFQPLVTAVSPEYKVEMVFE